MSASTTLLRLAPAVLLAALLPSGASAQLPRLKIAVAMRSHGDYIGEADASRSVLRRVDAFLIPALEQEGYDVVRVRDWNEAMRSGRYEAVVRVEVDARDIVIVPRASIYDKNQAPQNGPKPKNYRRRSLQVDVARSVEAWGSWSTWDGKSRKRVDVGTIRPIRARLQGHGESATLDDEENVARLLSEDFAKRILPTLDAASTPVNRLPKRH